MIPSTQLGFHLRPLLEQLDQEELSKFKSLLRTLSPHDELQHVPQTELEQANGKQLAEVLTSRCPRPWVEKVTIQAFDKMGRTDLSARAEDELRAHITDGKQEGSRSMPKKTLWKKNLWPGVSGDIHHFPRGYERLVPFYNPEMFAEPFPHTVVLHGPAGVGKTTLAKKWMLDWTQHNLPTTLQAAFYLSCRDLSRQGTCTFAELIAKKWPHAQEAGPEILAQAQRFLFVVDGFDELRVPSGSLVQDICGDWKKQKPAAALLGSLLKRKLFPKATLLITTRPGALGELRLLVEQPLFIEVEGLSERDRRDYFLRHFGQEDPALRALEAMESNPALSRMAAVPAVCWVVCTCLQVQMEKGEDPAPTCHTATSLFLRFLCGQFAPSPGGSSGPRPGASLSAVCLLATQGAWAQTSVFDREDLGRLGVTEADLQPFLDRSILQEDADCEGRYAFVHLSVQQFLAALFYVLDSDAQGDGDRRPRDVGDAQRLLSKEERLRNPTLTLVGHFLFGLANEKRARELQATFGCRVSTGVRRELLRSVSSASQPFSSAAHAKEAVSRLYESQEESLVKEAVAHVEVVSLRLQNQTDVVHATFCLQHCENLQRVSLQVDKGVFLENDGASESDTWAERSRNDQHMLPFWMDLCSMFGSNKKLTFLDISQSFLNFSSVKILCEKITSATCNLQKVVLRNISPPDAYRNFCVVFAGYQALTHLTLQGNDQNDMLPLLCGVLRHPKCSLQYLRLISCSATSQQWADLSSAVETNQSLTCLNLTDTELLDEAAKSLYVTLRHPKCFLQRLSLENCHLTGAYCKELSSALIVNQRLTHLCLAKNDLGDRGLKLLCEGLSYPECQLRTLVLYYCNITQDGCINLCMLLQQNSSLTHLDLGMNHVGVTGLRLLCEALKKPLCNLRCLWLWGCAITPLSCADLSSALRNNQNLTALDLGQNSLGYSGIKMLCDVLKLQSCPLQKLRLKIDQSDAQTQELLREVRESNPNLTIERDNQEPKNKRPSSGDFIF
ncbi:NACHT, LRR and PYD domains-containing protein 2 [Saccopteryx bilineata]|uniref:NACHT, LRR and PYD domains-containing protein 2 n=1 Tax=Saccopteryx bilineata TaxID=59482 RepID=UPI0033903817